MIENELAMFGCTVSEMFAFLRTDVGPGRKYSSRTSAAFAILSEAQVLLDDDEPVVARQYINVAKWLLAGAERRKSTERKSPSYGPFAGIDRRIADVG